MRWYSVYDNHRGYFFHSFLYYLEKESIDDDCCHSTNREREREREREKGKSSTREKMRETEHHLTIDVPSLSYLKIRQDSNLICIYILDN
jgi:hypothetical protein